MMKAQPGENRPDFNSYCRLATEILEQLESATTAKIKNACQSVFLMHFVRQGIDAILRFVLGVAVVMNDRIKSFRVSFRNAVLSHVLSSKRVERPPGRLLLAPLIDVDFDR